MSSLLPPTPSFLAGAAVGGWAMAMKPVAVIIIPGLFIYTSILASTLALDFSLPA